LAPRTRQAPSAARFSSNRASLCVAEGSATLLPPFTPLAPARAKQADKAALGESRLRIPSFFLKNV
jgi:hypothetical protein